jgi:hypothetical protein
MPVSALSPRLDDPSLDVMRRAIMQYLRDGNDPRVLPMVSESSIEEYGGLNYVVLRSRRGLPPLKVYRLFDDKALKGLYRLPPPIKAEYENAEVLLTARQPRQPQQKVPA